MGCNLSWQRSPGWKHRLFFHCQITVVFRGKVWSHMTIIADWCILEFFILCAICAFVVIISEVSHLWAITLEMLELNMLDLSLKIINVKYQLHLPGANSLDTKIHLTPFPRYHLRQSSLYHVSVSTYISIQYNGNYATQFWKEQVTAVTTISWFESYRNIIGYI